VIRLTEAQLNREDPPAAQAHDFLQRRLTRDVIFGGARIAV
jgi:hypothetical protein